MPITGVRNSSGSPESERTEILFMLTARWADDIRRRDGEQDRPRWHYINLPFKPDGEPNNIDPSRRIPLISSAH
jgi:hypothetical protein